MSNNETMSRIIAQKSLKESARKAVSMEEEFDDYIYNSLSGKMGKQKLFQKLDVLNDKFTSGRLIYKDTTKVKAKTSKHTATSWVFLEYNPEKPFNHFEEKSFPVSEIILHSNRPREVCYIQHPICIKRHCVERIVERTNARSLETIFKNIRTVVDILVEKPELCLRYKYEGGFVVVSRHGYCLVKMTSSLKSIQYQTEYLVTTIVPNKYWSNRRKQAFEGILKELTELSKISLEHRFEPNVLVGLSVFNNSKLNKIETRDMQFSFGTT